MFSDRDPIIAVATAPGKSGISVIRLSGSSPDIGLVSSSLFPGKVLSPRHAHLLWLNNEDGSPIDRVIVILYQSPHSYTGEEVLEIQGHGGSAVVDLTMKRCLEAGQTVSLRFAEPGEFTKRAFLSGRIDLSQAEAVADLIDASSEAAARAAARSINGSFSNRIRDLSDHLSEIRVHIESALDFPEEEIEFLSEGKTSEQVKLLLASFRDVSRQAIRGKVLRSGLTVVIAGAPNVGKSSLMNMLAGEEVAIVTDIAGTTRDRIERQINIDGLPVNMVDTAGLRVTDDPVEKIGIDRTLAAAETADAVLLVRSDDVNPSLESETLSLIVPRLRRGVPFITVTNKIDLFPGRSDFGGSIPISVFKHCGIDNLIGVLKELAGGHDTGEAEFLATTRQLDCLARAEGFLKACLERLNERQLELAAEELRLAHKTLGEIVGETLPDDILGLIFSRFCIGK